MKKWRVSAPAKLTWWLEVTGTRPDGFHDLRSEMVTLDLADQLVIEEDLTGLIVQSDDGSHPEEVPRGASNLVARALALVGREARVTLHKAIPVGGGLGGGSADAGAILRWAGFADMDDAARLGGDVPFCVSGGRALVEGIGERVHALDHVDRTVVLLLPPFGVNTAACYRAFDELVGRGMIPDGRNHLLEAALLVEPRLRTWRDAFESITTGEVVLAGSGSTLFVEGSLADHGLVGSESLVIGDERGRMIEARTVPASWSAPELF